MSYAAFEQSDYSGHPLELYRFALGDSIWLFTSADHEVAMGEDVYQPCYIQRGGFARGADIHKGSLDIEIAASNPLALAFRSGWLSSAMLVTVYRHHYQDSEFSVLWKGRVVGCTWSGSVAKLSTESVFTMFARAGLRRVYQVNCPHQLYGSACGVNPDAHRFDSDVLTVDGAALTVAGAGGFSNGYFTGGMCQIGSDKRLITGHAGTSVTLIDRIDGVEAGIPVSLWPGCDRTTDTCVARFNNILNYGGLPYLPEVNPFTGAIMGGAGPRNPVWPGA